jgi:hypothetical protein
MVPVFKGFRRPGGLAMGVHESVKKRRNIYMGQEYLDMEAIAVNERKRSGRDVRVADLIRRACREFKENYWRNLVREEKKGERAS